MNGLDIFFVVVLGFFLFRGIFRGLILEISSIAGILAGFLTANRYYPQVQPVVDSLLTSPDWAQIVAYLIIFFTVLAAVAILALMLKKFMKLIMLGWVDRLGGAALGLIKAGILCSLALLLLTVFLPRDHQLLTSSRIAPHVRTLSQNMAAYLPEELKQKFRVKDLQTESIWEKGLDKMFKPGRDEL